MGCILLKTSVLEAANDRSTLVLEGKLMKWTKILKQHPQLFFFWMGVWTISWGLFELNAKDEA